MERFADSQDITIRVSYREPLEHDPMAEVGIPQFLDYLRLTVPDPVPEALHAGHRDEGAVSAWETASATCL